MTGIDSSGNSTAGLLEECRVSNHGAELLGPVIPCNPSRQWKQPLPVSSSENHAPLMVARACARSI